MFPGGSDPDVTFSSLLSDSETPTSSLRSGIHTGPEHVLCGERQCFSCLAGLLHRMLFSLPSDYTHFPGACLSSQHLWHL